MRRPLPQASSTTGSSTGAGRAQVRRVTAGKQDAAANFDSTVACVLPRVARGQYFFRAGQTQAAALGVQCGWKLEMVAGTGHNGGQVACSCACVCVFETTGVPDMEFEPHELCTRQMLQALLPRLVLSSVAETAHL